MYFILYIINPYLLLYIMSASMEKKKQKKAKQGMLKGKKKTSEKVK